MKYFTWTLTILYCKIKKKRTFESKSFQSFHLETLEICLSNFLPDFIVKSNHSMKFLQNVVFSKISI